MNVKWAEGVDLISWQDAASIEIRLPAPVKTVFVFETEPRVLILYGPDQRNLRLAAFDLSGQQVLDLAPPDGYDLYYFSRHTDWEHAVVCSVTKEAYSPGEDNFDWFFAIDVTNKCLVSLNRAY